MSEFGFLGKCTTLLYQNPYLYLYSHAAVSSRPIHLTPRQLPHHPASNISFSHPGQPTRLTTHYLNLQTIKLFISSPSSHTLELVRNQPYPEQTRRNRIRFEHDCEMIEWLGSIGEEILCSYSLCLARFRMVGMFLFHCILFVLFGCIVLYCIVP